MVSRKDAITHIGKVVGIDSKHIMVSIESASACSACHAKSYCTSLDAKERLLSIANHGENISVNDEVVVSIQRSMGFQAVMLAFLIPLLLVILVFFTLHLLLKIDEPIAGLLGLVSLAPYFFILHLFRNKLSQNFVFHIEKHQ